MANIKVAVRVRPISEREINFTGSEIVVHTEEKAISLTNLKVPSSKAGDSRERTRRYGFDYCFDSSDPSDEKYASQSKIYETLGESILNVLFEGYNSCLVAYGQSASGKTYTMMGSKEDPGLTPRVCEGLFLRLENEERNEKKFDISVSYLEVYNERVRDLLKPASNSIGLKVREHPRLGPYVQGLTHHAVPTLGSLISRVEEGTRARKTASTLQNPTSSRSHALLTLSLLPSTSNNGQSGKDVGTTSRKVSSRNDRFPRGSKLHLVDLAGSESAAACGGINRLKEGANINKSLVALGNVISALAERGSTGSGPGRRFIPYRDSALTWLLKDALGGNATTIMLATISPASGSYNETSHTLRFAQRAQSVVNRPVINEDPVSRIIRELRAEVARLKSLLLEKNVDPDCKSICMCQRDWEPKVTTLNEKSTEANETESGKIDDEDEKVRVSSFPVQRVTTIENSSSFSPFSRSGYFDIASDSRNSSFDSLEPDNYNRAKVSELLIDDEVDEPVFVDIPTLVAVLIKPDNDIQVRAHQIEEIGSDGVPEDVVDTEFADNIEHRMNKELREIENVETSVNNVSCLEDNNSSQKSLASSDESTNDKPVKNKLRKHDSIDVETTKKLPSSLQSAKKFSSIENLTKKREVGLQRSQTNLEKRHTGLDKIKKLNNIREVEDQRSSKSVNPWRNFGGWGGRDLQRKGSNDSDKSIKDSALFGKHKIPGRKQSIDGLKRKTSKDSSSSSSKDELLPVGGQTREKFARKGSLEQEQLPVRTHTPIQRARRAEIVAAVTERLYSSKKLTEDSPTLPSTTASTPASEVRSPESTDVKLANATRMRLQEISRKMLAKRRRICVDTQTDNLQTVRVRDASSITEEPKIIRKDASILTDEHEDYEIIPTIDCPVRRVKEMATSTDSDLREPIVRCKDAANLTEDYYEDYATIGSPRNDSGIMSDDTQNYAESNLSSAEISDLSQIGGRSVELAENSTNTRIPAESPSSGSQTRREDLERAASSNCETRCCSESRHCRQDCVLPHVDSNQTCHHPERNVISISLPEMVVITIETTNGLESKIKVFDGNESIDDRTVVNLKDNTVQTDKVDALEIGTSTEDVSAQICFHDFSESKPMLGQTDAKTFRIENIFLEPNTSPRTNPKIEIVESNTDDVSTTNSLIVTNSVGTCFVPETRENATGMESVRSCSPRTSFSEETRKSDHAFLKNTWPSKWNSGWKNIYEDCFAFMDNQSLLSDMPMDSFNSKIEQFLDQEVSTQPSSDKNIKPSRGLQLTNMIAKDTPPTSLKSPAITAMLDRKLNTNQDPNFSDDSLDLTEEKQKAILDTNKNKIKGEIGIGETICPPDLVAHTKKEATGMLGDSFDDFGNEDDHIEFPKVKMNAATVSSLPSPLSNFKALILGDSCYAMNNIEDKDLLDFENHSSAEPVIDNEDDTGVIIDVVEDQCLVNNGCAIFPKSIIKKLPRGLGARTSGRYDQNGKIATNLNETSFAKRVRFACPEVSLVSSSDSETCDNFTSEDDEFPMEQPRRILEDYLDEAFVFMRNMNSMNEYMSASEKCAVGPSRRGKGNVVNYIQYEGRRISLEDDEDKLSKSDDDEDLTFNVESYNKCLRSMDRLEECLARVKRHEVTLRDNYGIGRDGSTEVKPDLAKFSLDSTNPHRDSNDTYDDTGLRNSSNDIDLTIKDYKMDFGNNNLQFDLERDLMSERFSGNSDNSEKSRGHRFSRFSSMRKRNPTSYSQLRNKYSNQSVDTRRSEEGTLRSPANIESSDVDGSENTIVPDSLQTPECYLILPKTTKQEEASSNGVKGGASRQRFSLSRYDSSNESSSSNEALATFMESIDSVTRSRKKIKYPGSPRAKFLQLLSERRRIVENTRTTGPT